MNYWIFQYTTKVYKNVLNDFKMNVISVWEVTKHKKNIKNGDIAIIYIGGSNARIICGLMKVTSDVFFNIEKQKYYVKVSIIENWLNNPITFSEAKRIIPDMFIGIAGTNFRSSVEQLDVLKIIFLKQLLGHK